MFNSGKNLGKYNCCVNYKFTIEKKIMFQTELCFYQVVDVVLDFSVLFRDITINCKFRAGLTHFSLLSHSI